MTSAIGGSSAFPSPFANQAAANRGFGIDVVDSARTAQSEPIVARNITAPAIESVAATPGETAPAVAQSSAALRGSSVPTAPAALALLQEAGSTTPTTGNPGFAVLASSAYQAVQGLAGGAQAASVPRPGISAVV